MQLADEKIIAWQRNPKVSIVIPVYNGADYLREAIDSALAQTYPDIEVIVVNDGSDDDGMTEQIALSYDARINYCYKENGGVASALNAGIRMMSGEYLSWLSHDDVYYPNKISSQIGYLYELGRQALLYSDYETIDSESLFLEKVIVGPNDPHKIKQLLILAYPIHGCTTLIPHEFFARVGLFNETLRTTQDYDMWFRIAQQYDLIHMPDALTKVRLHQEQGTVTLSPLHVRECNDCLIDSMKKVARELLIAHSYIERKIFLGECLTSFSIRGFHGASRVAFFLYLRLLIRKWSLFQFGDCYPITIFITINLARTRKIFNLLTLFR